MNVERRASLLALLVLLVAPLLVFVASPASAHSVLLATSPARSSTVASAPASVVLTFNEMPRGEFSVMHVFGPDGARRDSGHVQVVNDAVQQPLGGSRPAGRYTVDWRVISADGHPVSGQFSFTATAAAAALATPQPAVSSAASKSSGTSSVVVVVIVVAVLLVVGVIVWVLLVRRRRGRLHRGGPAEPEHVDGY